MKTLILSLTLVVSLVVAAVVVTAGDLNPPGAPTGGTMYTLEQIYTSLNSGSNPNQTLPLPEQSKVEGRDMIHMTISAAGQGAIEGSCTVQGLEDTIVVEGYSYDVSTPYDVPSGVPSGHRQHHPVTIVKRIDASTPKLYQAWVNNEVLSDVDLNFWRKTTAGTLERYYTLKLDDARIVGIVSGPRDHESVSLTFEHIEWTWLDGSIVAEDDWEPTQY